MHDADRLDAPYPHLRLPAPPDPGDGRLPESPSATAVSEVEAPRIQALSQDLRRSTGRGPGRLKYWLLPSVIITGPTATAGRWSVAVLLREVFGITVRLRDDCSFGA